MFLPETWANDRTRCPRVGVPDGVGHRPKWQIALDEIDRLRAAGVSFGDVLADAGFGNARDSARPGLSLRHRVRGHRGRVGARRRRVRVGGGFGRGALAGVVGRGLRLVGRAGVERGARVRVDEDGRAHVTCGAGRGARLEPAEERVAVTGVDLHRRQRHDAVLHHAQHVLPDRLSAIDRRLRVRIRDQRKGRRVLRWIRVALLTDGHEHALRIAREIAADDGGVGRIHLHRRRIRLRRARAGQEEAGEEGGAEQAPRGGAGDTGDTRPS
ncbi:MAG: transposase [Myxococcales bacterium]|nr:transposase [Myxococcales bacterium]